MKTDSNKTISQISSRGSGGTNSSQLKEPKRARTRAGTNRDDLELDQPLDCLQPPVVYSRRGAKYPSNRKDVQRSFWLNTSLGFVMIAILVFGSIFGVIFSVIETRGAFATVDNPTTSTSSGTVNTSSPSFVTTLVPFSFSTLVLSRFSTLVPSEITVYVQSDATTLVNSDATTLIPSVITVAQRDATAPAGAANISPTTLVKKRDEVTSTTGLVMSVTNTVTVTVYSTIFGRYNLPSGLSGNGDSQQTCDNGAQNGCMSTTDTLQGTQSTFVTSTISTVSANLLDLNSTTATTIMPDSAATITMTNINAPDVTADKATTTYSMICAVADVSSLLSCNPIPTGWYISPSPPRATSFLHPVFRFISSYLFCIKDTGTYQFLRLGSAMAWNQCCKVFVNAGSGKVVKSILIQISPRNLGLGMWEHISQIAKGRRPPVIPRGALH